MCASIRGWGAATCVAAIDASAACFPPLLINQLPPQTIHSWTGIHFLLDTTQSEFQQNIHPSQQLFLSDIYTDTRNRGHHSNRLKLNTVIGLHSQLFFIISSKHISSKIVFISLLAIYIFYCLSLKPKLATCVRSCLIYGSESWPMKVEHELKVSRTVMSTGMTKRMCGLKLNERKKSDELRELLGLEPVSLMNKKRVG